MANRYTKVIKTLKKKDLSEAPTNSLGGLYQQGPPGRSLGPKDQGHLFYPDADGNWPSGVPGESGKHYYYREPVVSVKGESDWNNIFKPDFTQDFLANSSTDTSNIIDPDTGTVKTFLPPNSRSFILGPLVDAFVPDHGYDAYSNIGYIQKDTRQFVLLGRVNGQFVADLHGTGNTRTWDGLESSFTAYNSNFTYAMATWFRDQILAGDYVINQPYFISGGTPQQPCTPNQCPNCPPNMYPGVTPGAAGGAGGSGGGNPPPTPNMGFGDGGDPKAGEEGNPPPDKRNPEEEGAPFPGANPKRKKKKGDKGVDPAGTRDGIKTGLGDDDEGGEDDDWDPGEYDGNNPPPNNNTPKQQGELNKVRFSNDAERFAYEFGTAGRTYLDYLTNRLPKVIDNKYLGDAYVNNMFKNANVGYNNSGERISVVRDNIIGSGGEPTYDPRSNKVKIPFNYDFDTNAEAIAKEPSKYNYEPGLNRLAMNVAAILGGDYGIDSLPVVGAGWATTVAKQFGGAQHRPGEISMDAERLRTLNPDFYRQVTGKDPNVKPPSKTDKKGFGKIEKNSTSKSDFINRMVDRHIDSENAKRGFVKQDYTPKFIKGRTKQLNEDRYSKRQIRLLREIKQPVQIQEAPKKYKIDFSHKYQTPNTTSQQTDGLVAKANERGNRWRTQDKYWGGYESQERMNIIHDQTGHGKWYMDMLESKNQERVSWRDSEIQEQLNEIESQKAMKELYGESTTTEHEKNFDKVTKIKNVVSTQRSKDIAPEYPTEEPPEMIDGYHPDLLDGSKALAMYNKLNPKSADSMPKTAYPELDKKVSKAKSLKKS